MNILTGLYNLLQFINENWAMIITMVAMLIAIGKKIVDFLNSTEEEKIAIAKEQIRETMLKLITEAEIDYQEFVKAGSVKRSQVISQIYERYPILSKVADQEELVEWLDETIDESLEEMRKIFEQTKEESVIKE